MKKGINIWSMPDRDPDACFNLAKECGFDGVELALGNDGPVRFDSTEKELLNVKAKAESYSIELPSLVCDTCWDYSISSDDEKIRKKGEENIIKQIETASILGCDTILVLAGMVTSYKPGSEVVHYEVAYNRAFESMCRLSEYAEKYNVNLGIENVGNKLLLSPIETRDFIDKINSPKVKHYFDVGNVIKTGYPEQWIDILGSRIAKVHVKDVRFEDGLYKQVDILSGDVNYKAVKESLRKVGYDDWITAEVVKSRDDVKEFLNINSRAMDKIINEM
ncbi:MAG: sugar phosphate isomerase/epimerase [Clostridia bacterium]|nr:sugar phosphate isomerase/epimerase [Clostridia bacterium]